MSRASRPVQADDLHSIAECAAYLKVCPATVYRLVAAGRIHSLRVGGQLRVTRSALMTFLHSSPPEPVARGRKSRLMATGEHTIDLMSPWRKTDEAMRRRKGIDNAQARC